MEKKLYLGKKHWLKNSIFEIEEINYNEYNYCTKKYIR